MTDRPSPDGRPDEPAPEAAAMAPTLIYPCGEPPEPGTVREVAPGVLWLRMPLPFALNHINLWVLDDARDGRTGCTVVDAGVATPEIRAAWQALMDLEQSDRLH